MSPTPEKPISHDSTTINDEKSPINDKHANSSIPSSDNNSTAGDDEFEAAKTNPKKEIDGARLEKAETTFSAHHPHSFPDGGRDAWLSALGAFFAAFCSFGWINCIGIFQAYYMTHQLKAHSPSKISWIGSSEAFFMFAAGPFAGHYFDSYGPRYILLVGSFLQVFGMMMISISSKYWHFILAQGVLTGIGGSLIFNPALASTMTWFFKRRAFAAGAVVSGSSLGGVIFPIMIPELLKRHGFGWTFRITGFFMLGMLIIANLTIRSRLPTRGSQPFSLDLFTKHFKQPTYTLLVVSCFFIFLGLFIPFNFAPSHALYYGMSERMSNYLIAILNGVSTFGRLIPNYYADKLGRYNMFFLLNVFSAIFILALWIPAKSNAPIIVFAALYGFASGGIVSVSPALVAQISDPREIGLRTGIVFLTSSVPVLIGNPIAGELVSRYHGGFTGLQIFAGVSFVVGTVIFIGARYTLSKQIFAKV